MTQAPVAAAGLLNPRTYDAAGFDPETRRILLATIEWFEERGKAELKRAEEFAALPERPPERGPAARPSPASDPIAAIHRELPSLRVDMQIADRRNLQIDQPVTGKLIEHMVKESDAGIELGNTRTIKIECHADFGFQRITSDFGLPHWLLHIVSWCR